MNVIGLVCRISPHKLSSTLCRHRATYSFLYPALESSNTNSNSESHLTWRSCRRQFSISSTKCSLSDKLGQLYVKRDMWVVKRKEFLNHFSAARFVNAAPEAWKPYLQVTRVDKPIGTWLLYLPCAFGISLATPLGSLPDLYHLGLFGVGAFLMRGAGCIINDLWDRDLDKHVERTKLRPLASGKMKPTTAIAFLAVHLSLSLGILLSLNNICILIGVASMLPVLLYPLAKRVTYFPQAVLGATFNVGAIMGYAAVAGYIDWGIVIPLYFGCFMWTMYYDTVYAIQDAQDDLKVGIKSTALLFLVSKDVNELMKLPIRERLEELNDSMKKLQRALSLTYGATLLSWLTTVVIAGCAVPAYFLPLSHLLKCMESEQKIHNRQLCWDKFVESRNTGLMMLAGLILGVYMAPPS